MTTTCNKIPKGYRGQKFEVRCKGMTPGEETSAVGWATDTEGVVQLIDMVRRHPVWNTPTIHRVKADVRRAYEKEQRKNAKKNGSSADKKNI
jgi:hypothetical protein